MTAKATKKIDGDNLSIDFASGQQLICSLDGLPEAIVHKLAMHGLSQKIGDSYSGRDSDECFPAAEAVFKQLVDGSWTTRVSGGGVVRLTQLVEALMNVTGHSVEDVQEKIDLMDDDAKKDLRAHPHIKVELEKIKASVALKKAEKAALAAKDVAPIEF